MLNFGDCSILIKRLILIKVSRNLIRRRITVMKGSLKKMLLKRNNLFLKIKESSRKKRFDRNGFKILRKADKR